MQIFKPILSGNSSRGGGGGEGEGRVAQICPLFSYCLNTDTSTPFSYSFHRRAPKSLPFHHFDLHANCSQIQYSW